MSTIFTADGGNISSDRYVDITSGVGGASAFGVRKLTPRLFTTNELFPTNSVVKFSSDSDLLSYLNSDSTAEEYKQGLFLFSYISKAIRKVDSIEIARWAESDTSAQVFGVKADALTSLNAHSAANLDVTLNGSTFSATIDISSAASYADVATEIETKIAALDASLAATTVEYSTASSGFNVDTNSLANGALTFASSTNGFLTAIGLDSTAIYSYGISAQTLTAVMDSTTNLSNNFGSFAFIPDLTLTQVTELATWNYAQNVKFQFFVKALKSEAASYFDALDTIGGVGVTLHDSSRSEYPWLHPAAELGAIDPEKANAFPNFMFGKNDLVEALITTNSEAGTYDASRSNYFGRTQEAGNTVTWYQRGYLMGGNDSPVDMSVYAAEQWFKAYLASEFLNMFNALPGITPDTKGRSIIKGYIDNAVQKALDNGAFSVGKILSTTQKAYITQVSGSENAWQNVQNEGYWYDINFVSEVAESGVTEWSCEYTLLYSKADKVRKVVGSHILI